MDQNLGELDLLQASIRTHTNSKQTKKSIFINKYLAIKLASDRAKEFDKREHVGKERPNPPGEDLKRRKRDIVDNIL